MTAMRVVTLLVLCWLALSACSTSRVVKPLDEGKISLSADIGGPVIDYQGNTVPMPLSSVSAAYGWNRDHTVFTGVHATDMLYGVVHVDAGVLKSLRRPTFYIPGISVTPALNFMVDRWEARFKLYPSIDINAYWPVLDRKDYIYIGASNWFELARERAHGEDQPHFWIPALHAGYTYVPGNFSFTLEAKYLAPFTSNEDIVVDYLSPTSKGAVGVYLRASYTL